MLFNLDYLNNTILPCFFFFFLIIDLYFLISAIIAHIFNPIAELAIPIGIPVIAEAKVFNITFSAFYSSIHFSSFLQRNDFLFYLYFLM